MILSQAIKTLIDAKGLSILTSPMALNILSDYNAFNEYPSSKNILRNVISEGYLDKIAFFYDNQLPIGDAPQTYLSEMYMKLGFRQDVSSYVLNSILAALGYPTLESSVGQGDFSISSAVQKNSTNPTLSNNSVPFDSLSRKDQENFLLSLVEYNEAFCKRRNLVIEILELRITGKSTIEIDYEVIGLPQSEISFEYSVFDQTKENGGAIECWRYSKHDFHNNRLFRTAEIDVKYPFSEITRIRIKLDEDWELFN